MPTSDDSEELRYGLLFRGYMPTYDDSEAKLFSSPPVSEPGWLSRVGMFILVKLPIVWGSLECEASCTVTRQRDTVHLSTRWRGARVNHSRR